MSINRIKRICWCGCLLSALLALAARLMAQEIHGHDHEEHHHEDAASSQPIAEPETIEQEPGHENDDHHHGHDHDADAAVRDEHAHEGHDKHEHEEHERGEHAEHGEHADEVRLTPQAIERHGITIEPVTRLRLASSFVAAARVAFNAEAMAHVGSVVTGRIVELKAKIGGVASKGDELFVVESPELAEAQSELLQRRTAVAVAESAVEPAKNAYERANALYAKNEAIALGEVQRREAEWKAAEGALLTAKAAVTAAENKLHVYGMDQRAVEQLLSSGEVNPRFAIRAPISGRVIEREVTLGELVSPDRDALLVLADMSVVWVVADVPESRLGSVSEGSKARVTVAARGGEAFDGTVAYIAPVVNADTRTAAVRIEVPNEQGQLRPGMFARVEITAAAQENGDAAILVVPEEAVQTVEGETCVFVPVEGEANTFAKRVVQIGSASGGLAPVISGLDEGDSIVTRSTFILKADLGKSGAAHEH